MVHFACPRHLNFFALPISEVGRTPFSHYWPSGVIRIGIPVWKWKSLKYFGTKGAQPAARTQFEYLGHSNPSVSSHSRVDIKVLCPWLIWANYRKCFLELLNQWFENTDLQPYLLRLPDCETAGKVWGADQAPSRSALVIGRENAGLIVTTRLSCWT